MNKLYALYNFEAEDEKEANIYAGEEVYPIPTTTEAYQDWTKIRTVRNEIGIVPTSYLDRYFLDSSDKMNRMISVSEDEDSVSDLYSNFGVQKAKQRSNSLVVLRSPSVSASRSLLKKNTVISIESYMLNDPIENINIENHIIINEMGKSVWKGRSQPYKVLILGYLNDQKYLGFKNFITYDIETEKFPHKVKRRYNQFLWLHTRLVDRYPNLCIPSLPEKVVTGNFDDNFIQKRKAKLELWLNRLSSHPVLGESEVFIHFLICDDDKWKDGKRKAENDELNGAQWMNAIDAPTEGIGSFSSTTEFIDKFSKDSNRLDTRIKNVSSSLEKISLYRRSSFKREFYTLGKRFEDLANALSAETMEWKNNNLLNYAFMTTSASYFEISHLYAEQSNIDINPLLDRLGLYRRVLQKMPSITQYEKNSIQIYENFQAKPEKLDSSVKMTEVVSRKDLTTHVMYAEINQFNMDKIADMKQYMKSFLTDQIKFYTDITNSLKKSLECFDNIV